MVQIRGNEAIWELGVSKNCMYVECTKHKKIYHCLAMIVTVGSCNNTYVIGRIPGIQLSPYILEMCSVSVTVPIAPLHPPLYEVIRVPLPPFFSPGGVYCTLKLSTRNSNTSYTSHNDGRARPQINKNNKFAMNSWKSYNY